MTMVEMIARVWAKESGDPEDYWPKYQREVLLILKAMRKPTAEMIEAAGGSKMPGFFMVASGIWTAMVDQAISEHAATAIGNRRA